MVERGGKLETCRHNLIRALPANLLVPGTTDEMIVDHAGRLHERVADRGADELEPPTFQILAHRIRLRRPGRHILRRLASVVPRLPAREAPQMRIEAAELRDDIGERLRILDRRIDLEPIADDAGIREQAGPFLRSILRDFRRVEVVQRLPVVVSFLEDGLPAQTRLGAFEDEELEQDAIVMHRHAPLAVVVADHELRFRPRTAIHLSLRPA